MNIRMFVLSGAAAFTLSACGGASSGTVPASPSNALGGGSSDVTFALGSGPFKVVDRLNRPAVDEVFATFSEHRGDDTLTPDQDRAVLGPQIVSFTKTVAGRSSAIANVLASVLTPDVQIADLSGTSRSCIGSTPGTCNNYLGIETGGATQLPASLKPFGGRALTDDIVTLSLGAIFGNTVPALHLAPDDGKESDGRADPSFPSGHRPYLISDHVTWQTAPKHFTTTFPYLGTPR